MRKLSMSIMALTLSAGSVFLINGAAANDIVRLGTEGAYPPYNFINDQNELDGFERELGDALCARAGLTCEWVINDWDTIIPNLVSGNYDTIIAGMSITEARAEVISFTENYLPPDPSAYIALAGTDDSVINEGVVAAQSTTIQASAIAESGADLIEFPSPEEVIAAVRNGEADAALADKSFLDAFVNESGGELIFLGEDVMLGSGIGVGVRQSDSALKDTFNQAIAEMKADGSLNELITKWFSAEMAVY